MKENSLVRLRQMLDAAREVFPRFDYHYQRTSKSLNPCILRKKYYFPRTGTSLYCQEPNSNSISHELKLWQNDEDPKCCAEPIYFRKMDLPAQYQFTCQQL